MSYGYARLPAFDVICADSHQVHRGPDTGPEPLGDASASARASRLDRLIGPESCGPHVIRERA